MERASFFPQFSDSLLLSVVLHCLFTYFRQVRYIGFWQKQERLSSVTISCFVFKLRQIRPRVRFLTSRKCVAHERNYKRIRASLVSPLVSVTSQPVVPY